MKNSFAILVASIVGGGAICHAQGPDSTDAHTAGAPKIPYSTLQVIASGDSDAVIAEKAAKVLPRPNQTAWMRAERTFFIHFGPNTFRGVEWGTGQEDPSVFNPTAFNADQWLRAVKEADGKMVILVCKHHDGLCLWPSRYTKHSVASSPWQKGKGNEVRDVAAAAHRRGVKVGIYLSPADLFQLRTNPKFPGGYYGNESPKLQSVIPTDPAQFKTDPSKARSVPPGRKSFTYVVDDYNRYFLNQLYELLTEYGEIDEVWFDGANPDPSVHETYDYAAWYGMIRQLQPKATIAVKGPDVRWVGNEAGVGRTTEWSVIPLPRSPDQFTWPDMQSGDLGSRSQLKSGSYLWWYPAEVNEPILNGWFWSPTKKPKSASQLIDIYYQSIGRNGNMLMNLSPDTRGLVPDDQLASLTQMAKYLRETFAKNLAQGATITADSTNPANRASLALDGNLDSWWEAAPGHVTAQVTLNLPKTTTFDIISLQEAVDHRGQRVESFSIEVWDGSKWSQAEAQTTIGHRRLLRLRFPQTTDKVRIRITGSRLEPTLAEIGLYRQAVTAFAPSISDRGTTGSVSVNNTFGYKMVYTTDGTSPTTKSRVYSAQIPMPLGGVLHAACLLPNGKLGIVASKWFAGLVPTGWKVIDVDSEEVAGGDNGAANAIDGDPSRFWHTRWTHDLALPHHITVDMHAVHRIAGFTYLPRQDGNPNGTVLTYRFETSTDGVHWTVEIASGTFANIRNNPSLQQVTFSPIEARFFRFTALREVSGNGWTSAAEISVLPARTGGIPKPLASHKGGQP